jgi:hypothetical protein
MFCLYILFNLTTFWLIFFFRKRREISSKIFRNVRGKFLTTIWQVAAAAAASIVQRRKDSCFTLSSVLLLLLLLLQKFHVFVAVVGTNTKGAKLLKGFHLQKLPHAMWGGMNTILRSLSPTHIFLSLSFSLNVTLVFDASPRLKFPRHRRMSQSIFAF